MVKSGRRAGRKRQSITKKVSLTLTEKQWREIDAFDVTMADYIQSLKKAVNE